MRGRAFKSSSTATNASPKIPTKPQMSSFAKSLTRKRGRKTTIKIKKMTMTTTRPMTVIRSERASFHG